MWFSKGCRWHLCMILISPVLVALNAEAQHPPQPPQPPHGNSTLQQALQHYVDTAVLRKGVGIQLSYKDNKSDITVAAGDAGQHRAMDPADSLLFGSGTKPVTAALILKRVDEGRLHLNDSVAGHLDVQFKEKANQTFSSMFGINGSKLTIWHLLSMQAGMPDFDVPEFDKEILHSDGSRAWTPFDFVRYAATQPWACLPGACVFYSSTNYVLLGFVLLALERKGVDEWTTLQQASVSPTTFQESNFANAGSLNGNGLTVSGRADVDPSSIIYNQNADILGWTCGNLIASTREMAAFFYELLVNRTILSEPMLKIMTDVRDVSSGFGREGRYVQLKYGAGLMAQQVDFWATYHEDHWNYGDWGTTMGHGGDTYGFASDQGFIPQLDATFSWVANTEETGDDVSYFISCNIIKIATMFVKGHDPPEPFLHCDYLVAGNDRNPSGSSRYPPPPPSITTIV